MCTQSSAWLRSLLDDAWGTCACDKAGKRLPRDHDLIKLLLSSPYYPRAGIYLSPMTSCFMWSAQRIAPRLGRLMKFTACSVVQHCLLWKATRNSPKFLILKSLYGQGHQFITKLHVSLQIPGYYISMLCVVIGNSDVLVLLHWCRHFSLRTWCSLTEK